MEPNTAGSSDAADSGDGAGGPPAESVDSPGAGTSLLPKPRRRSLSRTILEWVVLVAAALLIALIVKTFLFAAFWIPSESMVPTLQKNDRVLVNKLSYRLHDVHRGDIVVFTAPEAAESDIKDLVKRVIGLPGETIEGKDGSIYIDDRLLEEPYLPEGTVSRDFGPEHVPDGYMYVLGDNRLGSRDSTWFGPVPESDIVGRVFVRIWPPSRLGFF